MKLVVGLGNPGRRYLATRHNVGFRVVECFAAQQRIELVAAAFEGRFGRGALDVTGGAALEVSVLEPQTYMNCSGRSVRAAIESLPVEDPARDLLVVLDDVDLPLGRLRLRPAGGGGGHRGLEDVIEALGHGEFPRLRFGVGRPQGETPTADYVLQPFEADEEVVVAKRVFEAAEAVGVTLRAGVAEAMNRYNRAAEVPSVDASDANR